MCDPVITPIVLGTISAGLGIAGSAASYSQAKQNVAYQNAAADSQFQYQMMQASASRNFEQLRADQQEALMAQNRMLADQAYSDEISQLNLRLMQEQEAAAQAKQQSAKAGLQQRGAIEASGRLGNTVDNLIADYYRQQAQYDYATERNLAFTGNQLQEQKRGAAATRGSRIASQQPYLKQPVLDPLKPIPQPKPSSTPFILQGMGSVVGAATQAYGISQKLPSTPKPSTPQDYSSVFRR
jgi:hypothetical protein